MPSAVFTACSCVSAAVNSSSNGSIEETRVQSMASKEVPVVIFVHRAAVVVVR
jgi:hypothetical protein